MNNNKEQTKTQTDLTEEQGKALEQQNTQKIAALQERLQENQLWEMGGKGRILMGSLSLAAGSNITGSTGQLLQAATVNVIQSYGAQQIKLLADSLNSEVARTALQGLLAGAGAAAQGQSATPAALGASASVVLNNLIDSAYGETSSTLSLAEREARKNLVSTLITGTTHALGGEAALANAAAALEMENNYLSQAQVLQRKQELSEGENLLHNAAIRAKWDLIDTGQDVSFRAGEIAGIPATLYEAVEGIVNAALSPHETYLSLKSLFDSDNVLGTVSEAVKQSYIARLDKMDAEFEKSGASGSFKAV